MGSCDVDGRKAACAEAAAPGPTRAILDQTSARIETLLASIETALSLLEPEDAAGPSDE